MALPMPPHLDMAFSHFNQPLVTPPSPTLTNPDMILPLSHSYDHEQDLTPKNSYSDMRRLAGPLAAHPPTHSMNAFAGLRSPRPLSDIPETVTPPKIKAQYDTLASSPTLHASDAQHLPQPNDDLRRVSNSSISVTSEDIDRWPGFDSTDDLSLADAEDKTGQPDDNPETELSADDQWLGAREGEAGAYSSIEQDPLSRRADMILANAKKRLNMMEGNLRGARNSLMVKDSSLQRSKSTLASTGSGSFRDRYQSRSMYGHRPRQFSPSPLSSISTIGHNRMNSVDKPSSASPRIPVTYRSSSALGAYVRNGSANGNLAVAENSLNALRGTRSHEVMRDARVHSWMDDVERPVHSNGGGSGDASDETASTLGMDNPASPRPSSAATGDLKSQIDALKGRISSLKEKAKEDSIRRQSLNSSRTPSPFVAADGWQSSIQPGQSQGGVRQPMNGHSPLVQQSQSSPTRNQIYGNSEAADFATLERKMSALSASDYGDSNYEDASENYQVSRLKYSPRKTSAMNGSEQIQPRKSVDSIRTRSRSSSVHQPYIGTSPRDVSLYDTYQKFARESISSADQGVYGNGSEQTYQAKEAKGMGNGYHYDSESEDDRYAPSMHSALSGAPSVYHDAVTAPPLSHEDRPDAFDYENFFLHSAMGSFTRELRRKDSSASVSSDDSVETTRPIEPYRDVNSDTERSPTDTVFTDAKEETEESILDQFPRSPVRSHFGVNESSGGNNSTAAHGSQLQPPVKPFAQKQRKHSVESVSTLATFRTATEGGGSDEDLDELDRLARQTALTQPSHITTATKFSFAPKKVTAGGNGQSPEKPRNDSIAVDPLTRPAVPNGLTVTKPTHARHPSSASSAGASPRQSTHPNSNIESILALLCPPRFPPSLSVFPHTASSSHKRGVSTSSVGSTGSALGTGPDGEKIYPLLSKDKQMLLSVVRGLQDLCWEIRTNGPESEEREKARARVEGVLGVLRGQSA